MLPKNRSGSTEAAKSILGSSIRMVSLPWWKIDDTTNTFGTGFLVE
jgi:hypothetical protein